MPTDLICGLGSATEVVRAIPWGPGFGSVYPAPSIAPPAPGFSSPFFGASVAALPPIGAVGDVLVRSFSNATTASYPWTAGSGWGVRYSTASLGSAVSPIAADTVGSAAAVVGVAQLRAIHYTPGVGFGSAYSNSGSTGTYNGVPRSVAFTSNNADVITDGSANPGIAGYLTGFPWTSGGGFGAKYANASTTFTGSAFGINSAVSPTRGAAILAGNSSTGVGIEAHSFTSGAGFGSKYSDPATVPTIGAGTDWGLAFSPAGDYVAVGNGNTPYVTVYPWSDAGGFGAKLPNPSSLPPAAGTTAPRGLLWSADGATLFVGMGWDIAGTVPPAPAVVAYAWSGGFGAKYTDPIGLTSTTSLALQTGTPPPAQPDACGPLNLAPKTLSLVDPTPVPRTYPHVTEIDDWSTQQSVKLLWDKLHDHEARIRAGLANDTQWVTALRAHGDQIVTIQSADRIIVQPNSDPPSAPQAGEPGATPPPTPGDPGPTPDPVPGNPPVDASDQIDLGAALIVNAPDIRNTPWKKTAALTEVRFSGGVTSVNFTKRDGTARWPDVTPSGWAGPLQYTLWLFKRISGQWVGSAFIQFWHDRVGSGSADQPDVPSRYHTNWYYAARWAPIFGSGAIASGESIGVMVTSGNARDSVGPFAIYERSNVVVFAATDNGVYTFPAA